MRKWPGAKPRWRVCEILTEGSKLGGVFPSIVSREDRSVQDCFQVRKCYLANLSSGLAKKWRQKPGLGLASASSGRTGSAIFQDKS